MEWFSYVIAIGIGISAVISPWLVTKENNKHNLSLKKLDMYEEAKRNALSDFIQSAEDCLFNHQFIEQNVEYCASLDKLFIYFSNITIDLFQPFNQALAEAYKTNNYAQANHELTKIVQVLSQQIAKE